MFPTPDPNEVPTDVPPPTNDQPEQKKWTLMFYFASDNSLASAIVSQLKAIKDAGFHKDVNVIARYDPHDGVIPTHIFDVNLGEKLLSKAEHNIGFPPAKPFVRTLVADKLWSTERDAKKQLIRDHMKKRFKEQGARHPYDPPQPDGPDAPQLPDHGGKKKAQAAREPAPSLSLTRFLSFCAEHYPANHYMLFILGHGIVVGNDLFLFDAHTDTDHAVTLEQLREALQGFKDQVKTKLELVSFHSCSMSGLEVAYELKDCANYMLASEGPAFVGSWPYRQILLRVFNDVKEHGENIDTADMLRKIFDYCFYNSYDFQLAGYSFDLCLTDLNEVGKDTGIKSALQDLSKALIAGLEGGQTSGELEADSKAKALAELGRDLIVLSHLQAQSFYEENFTDLGDFCFCLKRRCENAARLFSNNLPPGIDEIRKACASILRILGCDKPAQTTERNTNGRHTTEANGTSENGSVIVKNGFAGPAYQYSHGLSIYFPWSLPVDNKMWEKHYPNYMLSADTKRSWKGFLETYFKTTTRLTQAKERKDAELQVQELNDDAQVLEYVGALIFNEAGQLKSSPYDKTGEDCVCPSMKNYPRITSDTGRSPEEQAVSVSADLVESFRIFQGDQ